MRSLRIRCEPFIVVAACAVFGCKNTTSSDGENTSGPKGEIASNAAEAWPTRPSGVPPLTREQVLSACASYVACDDAPRATPAEGVGYCVGQITFSAERAIPVSALMPSWERSEYFVSCVSNAPDCAAVRDCLHTRPEAVYCEEDGCTSDADFNVTCNGETAMLESAGEVTARDCTTAFATCDKNSPTGCTDRLFTACPDPDAPDRCEGNIRIGCDSAGQVSYRDCERLSGTCGQTADGKLDCVYDAQDPECTDGNVIFSYCEGENVITCVTGHRTVVPAPELCVPATP